MFNDLFIWLAPGMEQENKGKTLHRSDMAYMTELIPFSAPQRLVRLRVQIIYSRRPIMTFVARPKVMFWDKGPVLRY